MCTHEDTHTHTHTHTHTQRLIYTGLVKGLEVLRGEEDSYEGGGTILLLSDGEETNAPYVMEVLPQVKKIEKHVHKCSNTCYCIDSANELSSWTFHRITNDIALSLLILHYTDIVKL